ncbi:MAG TPA: hypothetical protein VMR37_03125 [Rhabdochlamydiaceae bacterium]|nr:hypothetical protein [Rhabdochlamydiaceae bacterium]
MDVPSIQQSCHNVFYTPEAAISYHKHLNLVNMISKIAMQIFGLVTMFWMISFARTIALTPVTAVAVVAITAIFFLKVCSVADVFAKNN